MLLKQFSIMEKLYIRINLKKTFLFFFVLVPLIASSQWLSISEFDKWENYLRTEYFLFPEEAMKSLSTPSKRELLKSNQLLIGRYNEDVEKGIDMLKYPQPKNLRYVEWRNDTTPEFEQKRLIEINNHIETGKKNYIRARTNAAVLLTRSHYNYPKLITYNNYLINEIRKTLYYNNIWTNYRVQTKLLSLLVIPETLKDSLLNISDLNLEVRAKLGDTASEDSLIKNFVSCFKDTILHRDKIHKCTQDLFFLNSPKAISAFCNALEWNNKFYELESEDDHYYYYTIFSGAEILTFEYNLYYERDLIYFDYYVSQHPKYSEEDEILNNSEYNYHSHFYFEIISQYLSEKFNRKINISANYRSRQLLINKK
jgi:hypothetical protein